MYSKNDFTNSRNRTKSAIDATFIKLLKTKSFDKIRISDICDGAKIVRATFYRYYEDKYSLLYGLSKEIIDTIFESFKVKKCVHRNIVAAVLEVHEYNEAFLVLSKVQVEGFDFNGYFMKKIVEAAQDIKYDHAAELAALSEAESKLLGELLVNTVCTFINYSSDKSQADLIKRRGDEVYSIRDIEHECEWSILDNLRLFAAILSEK